MIAGEPSGDLHGSKLIQAIKSIDRNSSFMGYGGDLMKKEGMRVVKHIDSLAIMGFVEIVKHLPRMLKIIRRTTDLISKTKPDRVILIDYPGFNLRVAKKISYLKIPITYFILPQIWAWKENRLEILNNYTDQLISIFPFEKDWYLNKNVDVKYFGHPFAENEHLNENTKSFFLRHQLTINEPILTLLPGSRQQEVNIHWPIFIKTVLLLRKTYPGLQIIVGKAAGVNLKNIPRDFKIESNSEKAMLVGTCALASSGTATLECAFAETPLVACYKFPLLTWVLVKSMVKVKYSSIVNLIANRKIIPELLQEKMTPNNLAEEIIPLLDLNSQKRKMMMTELKIVKEGLGSPGVYHRIGKYILNN